MKQRDLMLGLGLFGAFGMMAQSPFTGSVPPAEGSGEFYLYQVESGKWLQNNQRVPGQWTTHAQLDKDGFDVEIITLEDGYQINTKNRGNHSLNSGDDRFYMDTQRAVSPWAFLPISVDGVSNAFQIQALPAEGVAEPYLIGENNDELSDNPTNATWQLVTRQERIEKMKEAVANGVVDATWLIPGQDLGRNDERLDLWTYKFINNDGGGLGHDGDWHNAVREAWHRITDYQYYIVLKDLPNGTYKFTVQGFYRDTEVESAELQERMAEGTEICRAEYFAGATSAKIMPISKGGKGEAVDGKYTFFAEGANLWLPNSMGDAARAFTDGDYTNEWIETTVTDGTLIIGISKPEADYRDWLVFDNFQLQYVSQDAPAADLSVIKGELNAIIADAEGVKTTPAIEAAIASAKEAANSDSAADIRVAGFNLKSALAVVKSAQNEINLYDEVKKFCLAEGVDTTSADEMLNNAASRDDYNKALKELRYARRRAAAEKQEDIFEGSPVQAGEFYLYNIGQKQFLSGGSDWGAHAALSMPGWPVVLEEESVEDNAYHINTNLYNGPDNHYMNYRGYMDCGIAGAWKFIPVEGKENVYNIVQNDYQDVYVKWNPYTNVDAGQDDETTVCTEQHNVSPADPDTQWKLVSRAEREALLEKATLDNPTDASFFIKSPNFNQREGANEAWQISNGSIWEYGANHYDFAVESWNSGDCEFSQMIEGLPAGVYMASLQGFYRNGSFEYQAENEPLQNAFFYFGFNPNDEVALPNILSESGNAPGEGRGITTENGDNYNYPDGIVQATNFFKNGLYRTYIVVNKENDGETIIGVYKDEQAAEFDWVVADNFRLTYYGTETTPEEVLKKIQSSVEEVLETVQKNIEDNRTYNLQGIEVSNPTARGIYIRNGKKFVVK